jgi:hypothetical protein
MEKGKIDDIAQDVSIIIDELERYGIQQFKGAIKNSKMVLTGDLMDSVKVDVELDMDKMTGEANVQFNKYWRFKDMKELKYDKGKFIKIDGIRAFVRALGVGKFPYVSGYYDKMPISQEKVIDRIVRAIVFQRRKMPVVRSKKRKLYTKTKWLYIRKVQSTVMDALGVKLVVTLKGEWAYFRD